MISKINIAWNNGSNYTVQLWEDIIKEHLGNEVWKQMEEETKVEQRQYENRKVKEKEEAATREQWWNTNWKWEALDNKDDDELKHIIKARAEECIIKTREIGEPLTARHRKIKGMIEDHIDKMKKDEKNRVGTRKNNDKRQIKTYKKQNGKRRSEGNPRKKTIHEASKRTRRKGTN